ncbi:hypothetical protein B9Z55_028014 [Caenorhabditis nigoni]|nr:hypothetical protein B9Z55_028014 [Caenorhabditis nigoni]
MAALSLFREEMKSQAARGASKSRHIKDVSAIVSGTSEEVALFRAQLEEKKIFARLSRLLESQSPTLRAILAVVDDLIVSMRTTILEPKHRYSNSAQEEFKKIVSNGTPTWQWNHTEHRKPNDGLDMNAGGEGQLPANFQVGTTAALLENVEVISFKFGGSSTQLILKAVVCVALAITKLAEGSENLEIEETMAAMSLFWEKMKSQAARGASKSRHIKGVSAIVSGTSEEVALFSAQLEEKKIVEKLLTLLESQRHSTSHPCCREGDDCGDENCRSRTKAQIF